MLVVEHIVSRNSIAYGWKPSLRPVDLGAPEQQSFCCFPFEYFIVHMGMGGPLLHVLITTAYSLRDFVRAPCEKGMLPIESPASSFKRPEQECRHCNQ